MPNPRDAWPAWTDQRWTATPPAPSDLDLTAFARPTFEEPRPTPREEASKAGYDLGYAHDADAVPPAGMTEGIALAWWIGRNTGWLRRESDDREIDRMGSRRMDDDLDHPLDRVHPAELAEAGVRVGRRAI